MPPVVGLRTGRANRLSLSERAEQRVAKLGVSAVVM